MKQRILRISAFAGRCLLELVRDPLSYVFMIGFPLAMLFVMTVLNDSIPPQAGMTVFRIDRLAPAVFVFGMSFLMLFTAILVSKDRTEAFLVRLYISPMRRLDFLAGYAVPVVLLGIAQGILTMLCALGIAVVKGITLRFAGIFLTILVSLPAILLFIGFGLLFGTLLNDKSAPPLSSVIISLASFFGGMWMDIDQMSGVILTLGKALPFLHAVRAGRMALAMETDGILLPLAIVSAWTLGVWVLAVLAFRKQRKK